MQHQAKAQFQTGHSDVVPSEYCHSDDKPLTSRQVIQLFETLESRINSNMRDSGLRDKAIKAIEKMKSMLQDAARYGGISGLGMGRNTRKVEFKYKGDDYRIDLELSGEMKD